MSVGETLARAREDRGLSVDDVSSATRIRATLVRAIEADDFSPCGGSVYARGHIRSIAHVIGVDAEPLVAEFDQAHGGAPAPTTAPVAPVGVERDLTERTARRRPNWPAAMATVLVLICVLAAVGLVTGSGHHGNRPAAGATLAPTRTPAPSPTPSPTAATHPPAALSGVSVLLKTIGDRCWVSVRNAAGLVLFEGILAQGENRSFHDAKMLYLDLGNAGAVDLVVNGRDLGVAGAPGAVVTPSFGPSGTATAAAG